MTILSWKGRHGTCVVGPTCAQGDRRDLGSLITDLLRMKELVCEVCGGDLPADQDERHYRDGDGYVCMGPRGGEWGLPITRAEYERREGVEHERTV